jgi:hypothetical protein
VLVDLAAIKAAILALKTSRTTQEFFLLCFASIIRNASNADPVPVSGLEVTKHMRQKDADGRIVDPYRLFSTAVRRALRDMEQFSSVASSSRPADVRLVDATRLGDAKSFGATSVITSPPYNAAVDYYRRHQLEMFWLDLTVSQDERLLLLNHYIGRVRVGRDHPLLETPIHSRRLQLTDKSMRKADVSRANGFRHYVVAMQRVFEGLRDQLPVGAPAAFVVGDSRWNGGHLNSRQLMADVAEPWFEVVDVRSYPVKNRYMSYTRHNNASIDREYVIILERQA